MSEFVGNSRTAVLCWTGPVGVVQFLSFRCPPSHILLEFTLVVENDTTLHDVHTYTVALSPSVLTKCSIFSHHQTLTRTPHEWLKKTINGIRHMVILFHQGSVVIGGAGSAELRRSLLDSLCVVVDSWPGDLSCGVVFSGGPWLLDLCCLSNLCAVKRRRSRCLESHAKS